MKVFIRVLLREMLAEAEPTGHFDDRVSEVVDDIVSIQLPPAIYLPNIPKETQDAWIINQIKEKVKGKIKNIIVKVYPDGNGSGICSVVPLGLIKVQPINGNPVNALITARKKEGVMRGYFYYVTIYDNRMPTIVLSDPNIPANSSPGNQLQAHIKNNINRVAVPAFVVNGNSLESDLPFVTF